MSPLEASLKKTEITTWQNLYTNHIHRMIDLLWNFPLETELG